MEFTLAQSIFLVLAYLFEIYVYFRLFCIFFDRSQVNHKLEALCFLIYAPVGIYSSAVIQNSYLNILVTLISWSCIAMLYRGSIKSKLLRVAGLFMVPVVVENVVYHITVILVGRVDELVFIMGNFICCMVLFLCSLILQRICKPRKETQLSVANWLAILLIPTGSAVVVVEALIELPNISVTFMLSLTVVFLMINLLGFYLFDVLESYYAAAYERQLLEQQNRAYQAEFELMHQAEQQVRILHHDMKNHLSVLRQYAVEGRMEELDQYLDTFSAKLERPGYVHTGNPEVDSILNYKLEWAERAGARMELDVRLPEHFTADPFDLNVILGNLLDNAVEGLERSEEKELSLSLWVDRGVLYLTLMNGYDGVVLREEGRDGVTYRSRKGGNMHGMGLESVRSTVEKYHGQLDIQSDERRFYVKAMLYLS